MVEGKAVLDGVAGQGAPIELSFLEPGGAVTGRLLPTGRARDVLDVSGFGELDATLIDASTALVCVRAEALGLSGVEPPDEIESDPALLERLEAIRRAGAVQPWEFRRRPRASPRWASSPRRPTRRP